MEPTGKAKGGVARRDKLTKEERQSIATKAARARWGTDIPRANFTGEIRIGDSTIPCAVLDDGTRLLTQEGFLKAIGRSGKPAAGRGSKFEELPPFLALDNLKEFIDKELESSTYPIVFQPPVGSRAYGYQAKLLPMVCEVYLRARDAGVLLKAQEKFAVACDILIRGLAHVGITALVDEATGYQDFRQRDALARILEAFVAKELRPWIQTFPSEFYRELFRLRDLEYPTASVRRPQYFGVLTNDIVYKRLAPGVLRELKRVTERSDSGRHKHRLFQHLTSNIGYPKLREHLGAVVAVMRLSKTWVDFMWNLDRLYPKYGDTLMLPFEEYDQKQDDGKGL
jgi:hypothetical protein